MYIRTYIFNKFFKVFFYKFVEIIFKKFNRVNFKINIQKNSYYHFVYILVFSIIIFYINNFIFIGLVECSPIKITQNFNKTPLLKRYLIGSNLHPVYVYGEFSHNCIVDICMEIYQTGFNKHTFYFAQYNDYLDQPFSKKSPLSHPNILINEFCLINNDILVSLASSHDNFTNNWTHLSNCDFISKNRHQYVSNSFYIYQKDLILEKPWDEKTLENLNNYKNNLKNQDLINKQIEFVKNLYKFDLYKK